MSETKTPYPPSPPDVPEGLSDYADSFARQQNRVLTGLFTFLIFYFAAIALFVMLGAWCAATLGGRYDALRVAGLVLSATFVLFLVKGFFKRPAVNRDTYVEVTDDDHPVLFDFLHQLCDELGAPFPHRVYVCPDVIAEYSVSTSLLNLVAEPRRELLVGMGLVNCTNLSEFKAVLAHEFGQFCHLGRSKSYCAVVQHIVFDLIEGEDPVDRLLRRLRRDPADRRLGLEAVTWPVVYPVSWVLDAGHAVLWLVLRAVALPGRGMVWEQEFHADLVAVSAAGSDALTHALLRARFGMRTFNAALDELTGLAEDRGVYTNDVFLHQDRAAALVRWREGRPDLGLPPALTEPGAGEAVRVFGSGEDDAEDENTPPMWRGHPANSFREENAKEHFVPAVTDHRSPWLLFDHPADLKERMAYEFYRAAYQIRRSTELTPAAEVQALIDAEHPDAGPAQAAASRILESGTLPVPAAGESINLVPSEEQLPVVAALAPPVRPAAPPTPTPTPAPVPRAPQPAAPEPAARPPVPAAEELRGETAIDEVIRVVDAEVPPVGRGTEPPAPAPAPVARVAPIVIAPPADHAEPAGAAAAEESVAFAEAVPAEPPPPVAQPASGAVPGALAERVPAAEPAGDVAGAPEPSTGLRVGSDSSLERLLGAAVLMELPVPAGLPDTLAEGDGIRAFTDDSSFSISDPEPHAAEPAPVAAAAEPVAPVPEAHAAPEEPHPPGAELYETAAPLAAETLPEASGVPVGADHDDPPLAERGPAGSALIAVAETERQPFAYPAPPELFAEAFSDAPAAEAVAAHEAEPAPTPVAHPTVAFGSAAVAKLAADGPDDEAEAYLIPGATGAPPVAGRAPRRAQDSSSGGSKIAVGRSEAAQQPPPLTPEEEESIYTLDPRGPGGSSLLGGSKPPSSTPLVKIGVGNLAATGGSAAGTPSPRPAFGSAPAAKADAGATPVPRPAVEAVPAPALVAASVFETLVPAAGRRPAVRITFVKPGEKSPIGNV
ncbi:M48 family metallopeptidase [Gemmata sp.]|uniref:M48 family metallopeptidase n=1 Tax=Gemmata sp. TaxID=1914242 RepID=UPI003F709942